MPPVLFFNGADRVNDRTGRVEDRTDGTARDDLGDRVDGWGDDRTENIDDGTDSREYLFTDRTTWFRLSCSSTDPPDDRWLSIAETFEFLPEEE